MTNIFTSRRRIWAGGLGIVAGLAGGAWSLTGAQARQTAQNNSAGAVGAWSATGTLLESCTCAVPCTCNFGEGPSPHAYCHAVFAYKLDKASWNGVDLSGLTVAGADGPKGGAGFIDSRATPAQRSALEQIGRAIFAQGGPAGVARMFAPVAITHSVQGNRLKLDVAGYGGFEANLIIGRDGRSPVVVENNTTWPIQRAIKGKAVPLAFRHPSVGNVKGQGTNANYGTFTFAGRTADYAQVRPSASAIVAQSKSKAATADKSCCGVKHSK